MRKAPKSYDVHYCKIGICRGVLFNESHTLRDAAPGNRIDIFFVKPDMPGMGPFQSGDQAQ